MNKKSRQKQQRRGIDTSTSHNHNRNRNLMTKSTNHNKSSTSHPQSKKSTVFTKRGATFFRVWQDSAPNKDDKTYVLIENLTNTKDTFIFGQKMNKHQKQKPQRRGMDTSTLHNHNRNLMTKSKNHQTSPKSSKNI